MPLPSSDDGRREGPGVVASLINSSEGHLCLVLDDVQYQLGVGAASWKAEQFFTAREYSEADLVEGSLGKEELALIGENLIIRLLALRSARGSFRYGDP
jgi:hypothetical protein